MAAYGSYTGPSFSGGNFSNYAGYNAFAGPGYATATYNPNVYGATTYGGLATYGVPRSEKYGPASYSTSISDEGLAYAGTQSGTNYYTRNIMPEATRSYGEVSSNGGGGGLEQYGANITPQIDAAYEAAAVAPRVPVVRRQVIQVPGAPGQVKQIVRRVPTPIPDIIERVFVVKPQRDIVNLVIERPATPPAVIKNRTVVAQARQAVVQSQVVRVAPRSIRYQSQQAQIAAVPYSTYEQQAQPQPIQVQPMPVPTPAPAPVQIQPQPYTSLSYSTSFDQQTQPTVQPQQQVATYYTTGGYAPAYNYTLPSYAAAGPVTAQYPAPATAIQAPPVQTTYTSYGAYPYAYQPTSYQYPSAPAGMYSQMPTMTGINTAGAAYYGYGYPAAPQSYY